MPTRTSSATWQGTLREGAGNMRLGSGLYDGPFTFASRFESGAGTNPEELIGAAHAGCYSMFLAAMLSNAGFLPTSIATSAIVHLGRIDNEPAITLIELNCEAVVPDLNEEEFQWHAAAAKKGCPVSKALSGVEIQLTATLLA